MRKSVLKFAAVAMILMIADSASVHAGVVVYNFDAIPLTTITPFTNSVAIPPINDTGSLNLTAKFSGTGTSVFTVSPAIVATGFSGQALVENVTGSTLRVDFSSPVNFASINFAFVGGTVNIAGLSGLDSNSVIIPTLQTAGVGSGLLTIGSLTGTTTFSALIVTDLLGGGILNLDNLSVNPVPEIDASSSIGALTLLGSAVMMLRGRRPKTVKV